VRVSRQALETIGPLLIAGGAAMALLGAIDPWGLRFPLPWYSGDVLTAARAETCRVTSDWGADAAVGVLLVAPFMALNAMTLLVRPSRSGLAPVLGIWLVILCFAASLMPPVVAPLFSVGHVLGLINRCTEEVFGRSAGVGDIGIGLWMVFVGLTLSLVGSILALIAARGVQEGWGGWLSRGMAQPQAD
jgi:hypothetical protein